MPSLAWTAPSTPTAEFVDNGDGTTTHLKTGLIWMRCAVGLTWSGNTCTGKASTYSSASAAPALAELAFAGYTDWRLPSIAELNTIVEREADSPTVNGKVFPNTPGDNFLSSTPFFQVSDYAWLLNFSNGSEGSGRGAGYYLRLVRGGQAVDPAAPSTPTADFLDNHDGTVTHRKTGLTWMRCAVGKTWTGTACSGNPRYMNWSSALGLSATFAGYGDWRLPRVDELKSLIEYTARSPAMNASVFPVPPNLWTSEQVVTSTDFLVFGKPIQALYATNFAYFVNTVYGQVGTTAKTSVANAALLVRGEQVMAVNPAPPLQVQSLTLACPATLAGGATGSCAARADLSDFSSNPVAPLWTVSDAATLAVNSDGSLLSARVEADTPVTVTASYALNGSVRTATATIVVKKPVITALTLSCPASLIVGTAGSCTASAGYDDGASRPVQAQWHSALPAVLDVSANGALAAAGVSVETPVTISASYSEDGVSKTATATITIKPLPEVLAGLLIFGEGSVAAGGSVSLGSTATYSNGKSSVVAPIWSVSDPNVATINAMGMLTAGAVATDTPVTVSASYTEGEVTQTATWMVMVKAPSAVFAVTPDRIDAAPGSTYVVTAQNGAIQSCTSSNPSVIPDPVVSLDGSGAVGTVAPTAADGTQATLSCLSKTATIAQASITVSAVPSDVDRVFDWAESVYPELFSPAKVLTRTAAGYSYRYYSRQNCYLATRDGRVYYLGSLTQNQISDVGLLDDYLLQAKAAGF